MRMAHGRTIARNCTNLDPSLVIIFILFFFLTETYLDRWDEVCDDENDVKQKIDHFLENLTILKWVPVEHKLRSVQHKLDT